MYSGIKDALLGILKVPEAPHPPSGSNLETFRAAAGWLTYQRIKWVITTGVTLLFLGPVLMGFLAAAAENPDERVVLITGVALVGGVVVLARLFIFLTLQLNYELRWYMVTDRSLRIREGVTRMREMTVTFANIQEISITQGPIQRLFNIHDVRIRTAGGGGGAQGNQGHAATMHIGYFRGVANAEAIRDLMRDRLRAYRSAGLGDEPDTTENTQGDGLLDALQNLRDEMAALRAAATEAAGDNAQVGSSD